MGPSSGTPEGSPDRCPVCDTPRRFEPSQPEGPAPCPVCWQVFLLLAIPRSPPGSSRADDAEAMRDRLSGILSRLPPELRRVDDWDSLRDRLSGFLSRLPHEGAQAALTATAHKLARIVYLALRHG